MIKIILRETFDVSESFKYFANSREIGADKIANTAKDNGGYSLLTWYHFNVKLPYYKKASDGKFDIDKAKKGFKDTYEKIGFDMDQTEFQHEVGRLEVLGELIIRDKSSE